MALNTMASSAPLPPAAHAWLVHGWDGPPPLAIGAAGDLVAAAPADPGHARGWLLPGLPNLHSHAFQRAMAGLAERRTHAQDSFWTWRETMYRFAARIDPDMLFAIACQLYAELLEAGYTSVCEFHYLHHRPDGRPYDDPAAMSRALLAAARDTGIGMTLLPVLYMTGGFDGRPLGARQRGFGHAVDAYLSLLDRLRGEQDAQVRLGVALHSLRAVPPEAMRTVLHAIEGTPLPVHIHIAEQIAEVDECVAVRGARPVRWLLDHAPVDARWTLVHATHLEESEVRDAARSGATIALCPTTEANLGDGLFPLRAYQAAGGRWGIGSDSHISTSPVEELRWLEYGQRLVLRERAIAASAAVPSAGESLYRQALAGARGCGRPTGVLTAGARADVLLLDTDAPLLAGATRADAIDRWLFAGNRSLVRETWVGGRRVVADGRHVDQAGIARRYAQAMAALLSDCA